MSRERRYQAVYASDDTLSPGRAVEHATAEFDALFRAHYRRICRVIYRIVGQPDLAEELAAEAFWKLHQRRPAHLTNAEAWLCRTGVRLALDSLRKGRRRAHYESAAPRWRKRLTTRKMISRARRNRSGCVRCWRP